MPRMARKPKARPSGWFVYMVQCADGSLYTGNRGIITLFGLVKGPSDLVELALRQGSAAASAS